MITFTVVVAFALADGWMLSTRDVSSVPDPQSLKSPESEIRQTVEDRYFATPYYERRGLATKKVSSTGGFERQVWESFAPSYFDRLRPPNNQSAPRGNLPVTRDYSELAVRFLYDFPRLRPPQYLKLLHNLLKVNPNDYRVLVFAERSCVFVGSDGPKAALGYAKRAQAIRPNDPETLQLMTTTFFHQIAYGVGDPEANYKQFRLWASKTQKLCESSTSPDALLDLKELRDTSRTVEQMMTSIRKKGG